MDEKKNAVLETSAALFLKNGFHSTSIQDIAAACSMSKATIYKYFASKEELGFHVMLYISGQVLLRMKDGTQTEGRPARERLRDVISFRVGQFPNQSNFVDALVYSFSPEQREKYIPLLRRSRYHLFLAFAQMIGEAYQLQSEAAAWELTLNLNGLIREITFLESWDGEVLEVGLATDFILDSMEGIAAQRKDKPTILSEQQMNQIKKRFQPEENQYEPFIRKRKILETLRHRILSQVPESCRSKYLEAVELLQAEQQKAVPSKVILEALSIFLAQQPSIEELVRELNEPTQNAQI